MVRTTMTMFAAGLALAACGGGGLSGDYGRIDAASGRWDTLYSFKGSRVEIEMLGNIQVGSYEVADGKVYMTFGNQTQAFRLDDHGCIAGGPIFGTACKRG